MLKSILRGLLTRVPGVTAAFPLQHAGGHTGSATYCYGVWLKHLTLLWANGLRSMPRAVLEVGCGDSLGTGLAALLSGARQYHAIDVVKRAAPDDNQRVFEELVQLFRTRAPRPTRGWPDYDAHLDSRLFPGHILGPEVLARSLAPERIDSSRAALANCDKRGRGRNLTYQTWAEPEAFDDGSIDLVLSHSVLEYLPDLRDFYARCARWVRPGGWMSHQIDFSSGGLVGAWNGHYGYSDLAWSLASGKRDYRNNREPFSTHLALLKAHGFDVVTALKELRLDGLPRAQLDARWGHLSDEDLNCAHVFIVSRRVAG
jgi:SAM-dependent methyltransferase